MPYGMALAARPVTLLPCPLPLPALPSPLPSHQHVRRDAVRVIVLDGPAVAAHRLLLLVHLLEEGGGGDIRFREPL